LAQDRYGYGLLGLIPRFKDRGNRGSHFSDEFLELVERTIDTVYCTPTRPNKRHAFDQLRIECEQKAHVIPSYPWFAKRIAMRSKYALALSREGKRVAHRYELIRPGEPNNNHGAFPWDVCLTDHTLTDVELVCSETGENLGRAWLSILIDGFSRRILEFVLTFDPPSYRTLMMLTRRCVERHNRLPGCLVVDGGKEFQSVYFETLTAAYGVLLKRRPPGKARFGTIVERMFGTINTSFLHTLQGNTQNTRNIRQLTKSMNPKGHALYTLEELHEMLSAFVYEYYDKRPHPTLNCSPAEKFRKGIEISGARDHKEIVFDETFRLMTLPSTQKGTAKIQPGTGLKIGGFYYWAPEMRSRHFENKSVRVKYDPENMGVAWAYLGDQWIQCRPNGTLGLDGRTEKEMHLATLEWRRSRQLLGKRQSNSYRDLALFLKTAEAAKALRVQQAKDRAMRRTLSKNGHSEPAPSVERDCAAESASPIEGEAALPNVSELPPSTPSPAEDYGDF
jgi:transposase InsO family protein